MVGTVSAVSCVFVIHPACEAHEVSRQLLVFQPSCDNRQWQAGSEGLSSSGGGSDTHQHLLGWERSSGVASQGATDGDAADARLLHHVSAGWDRSAAGSLEQQQDRALAAQPHQTLPRPSWVG